MTNKTLFDAVEAELRNAQAAISNAGRYLDMLEDAIATMVKDEHGEYAISIDVDTGDESIILGLPVKTLNPKWKSI